MTEAWKPVTWAEFKEWMEAQGVRDGDHIKYIDFVARPNEAEKEADVYGLPWAWTVS